MGIHDAGRMEELCSRKKWYLWKGGVLLREEMMLRERRSSAEEEMVQGKGRIGI